MKKSSKLLELERRDKFLAELEETCPIHHKGTDIVAEAPFDADLSFKI